MTRDEQGYIDCPSCNSAIILEEGMSQVLCKVCGAGFDLRGHLCPGCHTYHQYDGTLCISCGTPLIRTCRNCNTVNWSGRENCIGCGESIDIIAMVSNHGSAATAKRLNRQMSQAQAIKVVEEMASSKRMAEMLAIEEARQAEIRQRLTKQKEQERKLLIVVFGAVAFFFLLLIAYAIVSTIL
jgi:hypothetical protein